MDFNKEAIEAASTIKSFLEIGEDIFGITKIKGMYIPEDLVRCVKFYRNRQSLGHDEYIKDLEKLFPNQPEGTYEASYYYDVAINSISQNPQKGEF
jgi:hypothetical protein